MEKNTTNAQNAITQVAITLILSDTKPTFNSGWLVVDAAFVDVYYNYFESEVWTRFGISIFVKISKLEFGLVNNEAKDCQYFETE